MKSSLIVTSQCVNTVHNFGGVYYLERRNPRSNKKFEISFAIKLKGYQKIQMHLRKVFGPIVLSKKKFSI